MFKKIILLIAIVLSISVASLPTKSFAQYPPYPLPIPGDCQYMEATFGTCLDFHYACMVWSNYLFCQGDQSCLEYYFWSYCSPNTLACMDECE